MLEQEEMIAKKLMSSFKELNQFQALQIACDIRRNDIAIKALGLDHSGNIPSAIEAIAIALGYKSGSSQSVASAIGDVAAALEK